MSHWMPLAFGDRSSQNLSMFDPAAPAAHSIQSLAILVFAIMGLIFVVVEGVLIYSIWRFRRRPGPRSRSTSRWAIRAWCCPAIRQRTVSTWCA